MPRNPAMKSKNQKEVIYISGTIYKSLDVSECIGEEQNKIQSKFPVKEAKNKTTLEKKYKEKYEAEGKNWV